MLTDYITRQLERAKYKILVDGTIFASIPRLEGVWANGRTVEACRRQLREVLEDWLVLKLQDRDSIPGLTLARDQRSPLTHA